MSGLLEQMSALEGLQEIDLKIDQLNKQKVGFPVVLKEIDEQIFKTKNLLKSKIAVIEEFDKGRRQARAALDLNKDRLERSAGRLEQIANSTEYNAVQKELEQLKKLNLSLEEQIKKADADIDSATVSKNQIEEQLAKVEGERNEKNQALSGQSGQLDTMINKLQDERKPWLAKVEARLLSQYDRIRKARGGLGISLAIGGRCQACNMMVPAQLFNEVHKGSAIHQCPSCNRILYAKK